MRRIVLLVVAALAVMAGMADHASASSQGTVAAKWRVLPYVALTVKPNYQSGYGPSTSGVSIPGVATATPGPTAMLGGGSVDFGTVVAGYNYIYKYAAQMSVATNDSAGFKVYGEGSTDFQSTSSGTQSISALYWMPQSGSNSAYTFATPFAVTTFPTANANQNITYGASTPPSSAVVWSTLNDAVTSQGFDYQIRVPGSIAVDTFSAYVVYTVIGN